MYTSFVGHNQLMAEGEREEVVSLVSGYYTTILTWILGENIKRAAEIKGLDEKIGSLKEHGQDMKDCLL